MGQKDFFLSKLEDAAQLAQQKGLCVYLDFYEPSVQMLTEREIARYPGSECAFFGGQEFCERKLLAVFPAGEEPSPTEYPIACLQVRGADGSLTHQDVLGALLGLGIERDKTGDIHIRDGLIQFFVTEGLGDFVAENLTKISRWDVEAKLLPLEEAAPMEPVFKEMDIIIPSMRMDAVIHTVYKLSRSEAAAFVKAEKVKLNHQPVSKPSVNVKEGDVVSVRTKGRFVVDAITGSTKKGNLKLHIKKFS